MSRLGQFEKGKQTLCIGLDLLTVEKNKSFLCYLGKNKKTYYEIDSSRAFSLSEKYGSRWTNPKGKEVLILPLKDFKMHKSKWDKEEYEEKIKEYIKNEVV